MIKFACAEADSPVHPPPLLLTRNRLESGSKGPRRQIGASLFRVAAAERVGRLCHGIEIDPIYVDVAIRRWQRHTGDRAIHAVTGKRFDDCANGDVEVPRGR
jgi:hypothetical protein